MSDGRHDGGVGACRGSHEALVGEGEQVFHGAASARDDDDVHAVHAVQLGQGGADLRHAALALDGDLADLEARVGPPLGGVDHHVILGLGVPPADQPDRAGKEGQGLLAGLREESLGGQAGAQRLDLGEQVAHALQVYLRRLEVEAARTLPEHGFDAGDDARSFRQGSGVHDPRPGRDRH